MKEIIRELSFNKNYLISNYGYIISRFTNKKLIGDINSCGYKRVLLNDGKKYFIHRLVMLEFMPNEDNNLIINHIDGNKLNNRLDNLEWCTRSENDKHAFRLNLRTTINKRRVAQIDENNNTINIFNSIKDAMIFHNMKTNNITLVCQGKRKKAYGYKWKYLE